MATIRFDLDSDPICDAMSIHKWINNGWFQHIQLIVSAKCDLECGWLDLIWVKFRVSLETTTEREKKTPKELKEITEVSRQ